ncbi:MULTISPECIES: hypothetical protein [unclassified Roseateles]|uniref:hypothetical protein n=1 Tax=unclassified Roseateles TaxID=2626991 RepID=UPI0006F45CDA|nr:MULTISPECIES: hypothetical protein [unclassified Roseateles]KQW51628.1 hypothetical protein ASC81_03095 [Pelomonas sp. Root405]KRA77861.1 hypothetical protein ASD88_03095 [Pelomonas sp. Root662]
MFSTVLAALGLAACIALAVHMALPYRARARTDAALARLGGWVRGQIDRATGWRRRQRQTRAAALEAERVIRKARQSAQQGDGRVDGEWDGNVYRPKSFDKPKKPH